MDTDKSPTVRVLFRVDRGDFQDVTAVFDDPDFEVSKDGYAVCYAHIGQHSECSREWYNGTRAAKPSEYAPLLAELRQVYSDCRLIVGKRAAHAFR